METIKSLCPYCGVGCGLEVVADKKQSWKVRGDRNHPSSQGMVCIKGATVADSIRSDRLLYPMMRDTLDQPFRRASWDEALDAIVNRIQKIRSTSGPDALCVYGSGQFVTEDYYVAQKLMKGCLGTNNFDANSRLCMSSAVSGYVQSFGSDGPPCCYDDLELTDCAFIIGSNAAECHPIVFNRLAKYHKKHPHVKMIVVDPRRTPTAEAADLHLAIKPGTDIDLLNGIAYLLLRSQAIDPEFIQECTANFSAFAEVISSYTPEFVASRCGITVSDLETAANYWEQSQRVLSLWSMGMNQSSEGTAKVRSLINLHLMTGQIGKPGSGPFSLTGQPNAMGGREVGGLSNLLPAHRDLTNPLHREEVQKFWKGTTISPKPGLTATQMIDALNDGSLKAIWIICTNPLTSLPNARWADEGLKKAKFVVVQDITNKVETLKYADVILPATTWTATDGTMTRAEA